VTTTVIPQSERDEVVALVREFVEREVMPVAGEFDARDEYPTVLVEQMRELGLFGVSIAPEYGGLGLDVTTYARIQMELSRGWMSLAGVLNTHAMAAWLISTFGTAEQRENLLPRLATGEMRAAYSISEPHAGSDVQAILTRAVRDGDDYLISGEKLWVTNGLRSGLVVLLAKTDSDVRPAHRGISAFLVEKEAGVADCGTLTVTPSIPKLGYRGVETTGLVFADHRVPAESLLGGDEGIGRGFAYFMGALELGRINVAARGVGIATAAYEHARRYAGQRETFGKRIADHQAIQIKLADMATQIRAAHLLTLDAAARKDEGRRVDLEAGMAKLFATETAQMAVLEALRIFGGFGYSKEFPIERLYRDAPLLIVGEGTNEIQRLVIARRLLERDDLPT
jgi:alkylation response protein AidB-like acyl-CoA dehydrogenase